VIGEGADARSRVTLRGALGTYVHGGPVILCRDSRPSGAMLSSAATAGLLSAAAGLSTADRPDADLRRRGAPPSPRRAD